MPSQKRLGDLLVEMKFIDEGQLRAALEEQRRSSRRLGKVLIDMGAITESRLVRALSRQLGIEICAPLTAQIHARVKQLVPADIALRFHVIPMALSREGTTQTLFVATADPLDMSALEAIRQRVGSSIRVRWMLAGETEIELALARHYATDPPGLKKVPAHFPPHGESVLDPITLPPETAAAMFPGASLLQGAPVSSPHQIDVLPISGALLPRDFRTTPDGDGNNGAKSIAIEEPLMLPIEPIPLDDEHLIPILAPSEATDPSVALVAPRVPDGGPTTPTQAKSSPSGTGSSPGPGGPTAPTHAQRGPSTPSTGPARAPGSSPANASPGLAELGGPTAPTQAQRAPHTSPFGNAPIAPAHTGSAGNAPVAPMQARGPVTSPANAPVAPMQARGPGTSPANAPLAPMQARGPGTSPANAPLAPMQARGPGTSPANAPIVPISEPTAPSHAQRAPSPIVGPIAAQAHGAGDGVKAPETKPRPVGSSPANVPVAAAQARGPGPSASSEFAEQGAQTAPMHARAGGSPVQRAPIPSSSSSPVLDDLGRPTAPMQAQRALAPLPRSPANGGPLAVSQPNAPIAHASWGDLVAGMSGDTGDILPVPDPKDVALAADFSADVLASAERLEKHVADARPEPEGGPTLRPGPSDPIQEDSFDLPIEEADLEEALAEPETMRAHRNDEELELVLEPPLDAATESVTAMKAEPSRLPLSESAVDGPRAAAPDGAAATRPNEVPTEVPTAEHVQSATSSPAEVPKEEAPWARALEEAAKEALAVDVLLPIEGEESASEAAWLGAAAALAEAAAEDLPEAAGSFGGLTPAEPQLAIEPPVEMKGPAEERPTAVEKRAEPAPVSPIASEAAQVRGALLEFISGRPLGQETSTLVLRAVAAILLGEGLLDDGRLERALESLKNSGAK